MIYITDVKSFQFNTTPGIRFGAEESKNTAEEVTKKLGKKILFVTDPGLVKLGLIDDTLSALKSNSDVLVFDNVEADPSLKTLMKCVEIKNEMGWCDDVNSSKYNKLTKFLFSIKILYIY